MSLWTIELVRIEVGPQPLILSGPREKWLWRAYRGSDNFSDEILQEKYDAGNYLVGVYSGRIAPKADALKEAKEVCMRDDLRRGQETRELVGYDTGLTFDGYLKRGDT